MASTVTEMLRRRFGGKKGILPQGYTQLEYIQSANKSIIITTANSGDEFIVTAQGAIAQATQILIGHTTVGGGWMGVVAISAGEWAVGGNAHSGIKASVKETMLIIFNNNGVTLNIEGRSYTRGGNFSINNSNVYIFGYGARQLFDGKIFEIKQFRNGEMIANFVPCSEDATSKVGFYDVINNTFIEY